MQECDITALLLVVVLLAHPSCHRITFLAVDSFAFLAVDSVTLTVGHIPAFLFRNLGALSIIDDTTLLRRNIFTDLIMNSLTLLLVDNLALSLSSRCALLFLNRVTSILESVTALLIVFS